MIRQPRQWSLLWPRFHWCFAWIWLLCTVNMYLSAGIPEWDGGHTAEAAVAAAASHPLSQSPSPSLDRNLEMKMLHQGLYRTAHSPPARTAVPRPVSIASRAASLTFLTDFSVGTAVNAAEGISPTFMFTSLLFLLTVNAEYFSATFSVSLTYFVACLTSALQSTTESVIAPWWWRGCRLGRKAVSRFLTTLLRSNVISRVLAPFRTLPGLKMTGPTSQRFL